MIQSEEESSELKPFSKKYYQERLRYLTPYSQYLISEQDIYDEEFSTYVQEVAEKMEFKEKEGMIVPPLWFGLF